jgi:glutamate racemase
MTQFEQIFSKACIVGSTMKLGIFDSGIGGEAVAASLQTLLPEATIQVVNDRKNVPYGSKTTEEVISLTHAAIQPLLEGNCDIIILACNTASAAAIETLRTQYPEQDFIGFEPMVKPAAALSKTGVIAVCATPSTLASHRYAWLVEQYAKDTRIIEPDCSRWAYMIENNQINRDNIASIVNDCCDAGADIIVLGCTHYHWIKDLISEIAGERAMILEPSEAIARRVQAIMSTKAASADITLTAAGTPAAA